MREPFRISIAFLQGISSEIDLPILEFGIEIFELKSFSSSEMTDENSLSFLTYSHANPRIMKQLKGLVVVDPDTLDENRLHFKSLNYVCVENPKYFFAQMYKSLVGPENSIELKSYSVADHENVDRTAKIAQTARIHPNVVIGRDSIIFDGVIIHDKTVIGNNVVIKDNSVIGGKGFGYAVRRGFAPIQMPHLGGVNIEDNVHIGSCTTIDRGSFGDTLIQKNSKIDNGVHIAHNVIIRENVIITAHAEISGSVVVGENSWIGPNVSIREKLTIGRDSLVGIGSVVIKNVDNNVVSAGVPARQIRKNF
jgi:UDP-3-O-[3-hydroxymyristoyl] glucosamine N-acyltransferase